MHLHVANSHRKTWYSSIKFTSPKQPVIPYDRKPANFKRFLASLKASAANACLNMVHCMENQSFAEASNELHKILYNWAMDHVNQFNLKRYFWPNKGNGYKALQALCADPGVVSYAEAKATTKLKALWDLMCHSTYLLWFFEWFDMLIAKTKITNYPPILSNESDKLTKLISNIS
jgi:hypothetical protein